MNKSRRHFAGRGGERHELQTMFAVVRVDTFPVMSFADRRHASSAEPSIPFKLYRDYLIVVQGSLGGREALNFLIDTGVNPTVIDSRIAKKLGLTGGATVSWASSRTRCAEEAGAERA